MHWWIVLFILAGLSDGLHIRGVFRTSDFFGFLAKFGFQKTDIRNREDSQGFIYGNITVRKGSPSHADFITLAVLDRGYFLEYYGNRTLQDKSRACERMFAKISEIAYDSTCFDDGEEDFIRAVPCPKGKLCPDEDDSNKVVKNAQFTYRIQDLVQSRFWYTSLVSCTRNRQTCKWEAVTADLELDYDIWFVNGSPEQGNTGMSIFRHQYSCDNQDLLAVYLLLLLLYLVLTPIQVYATVRQNHPITRFLAAGLAAEVAALIATNLHNLLFAFNGRGVAFIGAVGEVLEIFSQSLFMLLLLLLAMGWAVTRQELKCKIALFSLWTLYTLVHFMLYVWKKTEVDVIEDVDEYQTIPGVIILVLRVVVMFCFLLALRETMTHEFNHKRLEFFLHFGAASLVWFIYLPLVALVALHISALWRKKFLIGITYSADTFAYAVIMHLFWPDKSGQYFLLAVQNDASEELEELYESAHNLHENNRHDPSREAQQSPPVLIDFEQLPDGKFVNA